VFSVALIVFRETLEAALLIGVLAAATRGLPGRGRWLGIGIAAGIAGALVVAGLADRISNAAEGSGQEILNAGILGAAVLMLAWHNIWMASHGAEMAARARALAAAVTQGQRELSALALIAALAVLREGSETALFLYGMSAGGGLGPAAVLVGGAIGLLGGAGLGYALYAGLARIPLRSLFTVTGLLILLVAAGMAGQMARFLIQGDLLPSLVTPLWDVSHLLPLSSPLGSTLRVLVGYDPRPSGMEVVFYVCTLTLILFGMYVARPLRSPTPS